MAYSGSDITAAEQTGSSNDAWLLCGKSVIELAKDNAGFTAEWDTGGVSGGGTDDNATYPTTRAYDRLWHNNTRPTTAVSSGNPNWLVFDAGSSSVFDDFDVAVILGHNLGGSSATLSLQASDNADIDANGTEIATWSPSAPAGNNETRLVSIDLDDGANAQPQVFTGLRFLGLKISSASTFTPQIGEVWLGKRRQMTKPPEYPYNPDGNASDISRITSRSGIIHKYTRSRNGQVITGNFKTDTAAKATVLTSLWADINQSGKTFILIDRPSTVAGTAYVMDLNSSVIPGGEHIASLARRWSFNMTETAPFFGREG